MQPVDEPQRSVRVKRIALNTRVSGKCGDLLETGEPGRRKRARIYGTVIEAIDAKRYKVLFDNNTIQECYSNSLRVESLQSLPPDLPLLPDPVQQQEQPGTVVADTNIAPSVEEDDASEEDLPLHRPEDDEISEAAGEPDDEEQRPVGMIPRGEEHEPALRTYHRRKMEAQDKIRQLIGTTVREKSKNQSILWTVVEKHEPSEYIPPIEDNQSIGWTDYKKLLDTSKNTIFASLFLELMFKDKAHIKELVTGGVFVCLSGTAPNGIPLIALGYRYSRKTVLFFVMSSAAGSTKLGNPYKMKYTDGFGNLCERNVDRPEVISKFFEDSNVIDTHNHVRQFELAFEKKWLTKDPFFRLTTTIIGMCVTDAWRLASVHKLINNSRKKVCIDDEKKMAIKKFSGIVAFQLISTVSTLLSDDPMQVVSIFSVGEPKDENDDISQLNSTLSSESSGVIKVLRTLTDANHKPHRLVKLPRKRTENSRHKGTMARKCKLCQERGIRHDVVYYCLDCGENNNYCSLDQHNKTRDCFMEHVRSIKRCLPSRRVVRTTEV
jgi:hypothetical protein